MNDKQLPPLPTPKFTETIRGVPCITLTEHEHLMRTYALQARAQVQGEAFGYIHHFTAHDESGALIDTTWEADGCADPLPHPTFPSMWKWAHCTPFYTAPQPAQATQAEMTDEREAFESCTLMEGSLFKRRADDPDKYWDGNVQDDWELWQARAILALRPERVPMTEEQIRSMCKQGWVFETVKQWVRIIEAHHGITAQGAQEGV